LAFLYANVGCQLSHGLQYTFLSVGSNGSGICFDDMSFTSWNILSHTSHTKNARC